MARQIIYVTGLYSGPSPSAGRGVARCLRAGLGENVELVGVDYWSGSSGLHDPVFDRIQLKPSWDLLETSLYTQELTTALSRGEALISTMDVETAWLSRDLGGQRGWLGPTAKALRATLKPRPAVAELLPFAMPPSLDMESSDEEIHAFCRQHSWRVWLKGPYHEAFSVSSWRQLEALRGTMRDRWQTSRLSLQAHVRGREESIALCAVDGKLVDAVHMEKRVTTPDGKTWAGRVGDVSPAILAMVEGAVRTIGWSGGAEIELLVDADGGAFLMEWNPRFPAWIYGAALAGRNLPAQLAAAQLGLRLMRPQQAPVAEFTRVVDEIPVSAAMPLPLAADPEHGQLAASGKYGAALPSLVPILERDPKLGRPESFTPMGAAASLDEATTRDLTEALPSVTQTPARVMLPRVTGRLFASARTLARRTRSGVNLSAAYSIKTCPDAALVSLARRHGLFAEAISALEVKRALASGYAPDEIILNGPGKWWPHDVEVPEGLRAVFFDSVDELERVVASGRRDRVQGVRLRLPGYSSRFGVPVENPADFDRLAASLARLQPGVELGLHFHMASSAIGRGHWLDAIEAQAVWAAALGDAAGRPVTTLDLGGGFHPDDLAALPWDDLLDEVSRRLPDVKQVYVEPGKALSQTAMAMVTEVLDVRHTPDAEDGDADSEAVIDACIAELPVAWLHPHRVVRVLDDGRIVPLVRGKGRLLGRICMEDDIVASGFSLPRDLKVGDRLAILDAGAYDRSMSYGFGRGGY